MEVVVAHSPAEFDQLAAAFVAQRVAAKPNLVLGLPTGSSPQGMFRELIELVNAGKLSLEHATIFNTDEFVGIEPSHRESYNYYMHDHLLDHVRVKQYYCPDGLAADPHQEAARYAGLIQAVGGLDLLITGLGANGHICFNEPGSPLDSRTRVIDLAPETLAANRPNFAPEPVPLQAFSVGVADILEFREVLILATGNGKEWALNAALKGTVSPRVPASIIQCHPRATLIVSADLARATESRLEIE